MAQSQAGMASLVAVRVRPTPVLDQEKGQPLAGAGEVFLRVDGAQDRVGRDLGVEALDERAEGLLATRELVKSVVQLHAILGAGMHRELRYGYLGALVTLVVQFMLGMTTNLFVDIPKAHPGANPPEYFTGVFQNVTWAILHGPSLWLTLHAVVGLLLVAFGFRLLVPAIRSRNRTFVVTAVVGALGILAAGFNGGSFVNYHEDFSSMLMASFFAIAVTSYAVGLWALPALEPTR